MKQILSGLMTILVVAGCSTKNAAEPDVNPAVFAVQIFEVDIPGDEITRLLPDAEAGTQPILDQAMVDQVVQLPNAAVYEYPVFTAAPGKLADCDQTVSKEMMKDCEVIDGKTVKTMETVKLGRYAQILISQINGPSIAYHTIIGNRSLFGTETRTLENGDQVEFPFYDSREINMVLCQSTGDWLMPGGILSEQVTENGTTTQTSHLMLIRFTANETENCQTK